MSKGQSARAGLFRCTCDSSETKISIDPSKFWTIQAAPNNRCNEIGQAAYRGVEESRRYEAAAIGNHFERF